MYSEPTASTAPFMPVFQRDFTHDPYPFYTAIREQSGGIVFARLGTGVDAWIVTSYELGRILLTDSRLSKDSRHAGASWHHAQPQQREGTSEPLFRHLLTMDPPEHTELRALVQPQFTRQRVSALRPRIEAITDELLDAMVDRTEVEFIDDFAFPLPILVICELLGVPTADRERFRRWSRLLVAAEHGEEQEGINAADEMRAYLAELAERKRAEPDGSLYSELTEQQGAGKLTQDHLVSMAFLLLVAGHETTVNLLGNGMLALLTNPDQLAFLRGDTSLIPNAVEEFLRFEGPLEVATPRFATEGIHIGGADIQPGDTVFVVLAAGNRDPSRFSDPDAVDMSRQATGHLAFGHGIHHCLGAPLARLEAVVAFERVLRRLPSVALAVDFADIEWRAGLIMRGVQHLPMRLGTE